MRYGDSAKVKLLRTNESVEIVVTDQGPGIPPDGRDRVFNPFVRLETHHYDAEFRPHGYFIFKMGVISDKLRRLPNDL